MAIGGVVIQFLAKTATAIRDIDLLSTSLDDAGAEVADLDRALVDVQGELATTGSKASGLDSELATIEDAFSDLAREVDSTVDTFGADMDRMGRSVADASTDVDTHTGTMRREMGEVGRETGAEFIGNIAEGIGSGSGSLNDVVSGTLGGLTNLAASLAGPVGMAAGVAAGAIGLMWNKMQAEAEEAKEQINGLIDVLEETEDEAKDVQRQKIFEKWLADAQQLPDELSLIIGGLQDAGVESEDFRDAIGGSEDAARKVVEQIDAQIAALEEAAGGQVGLTDEQRDHLEGLKAAKEQVKKQNEYLVTAKGHHKDINWLQGESKEKQEGVTGEIKKSRNEAKGLKSDLDAATADRSMKVKIYAQGSGGSAPALPSSGYPSGPRSSLYGPPVPTYQTIQPPIAIVTREQIYRAVRDLLVEGDARNGRAPA